MTEKKTSFLEVNFDGLVGPTHQYAGLSGGNLASMGNALQISNPKEAALQGLKKMRLLVEMGVPQAVLPPQERPSIFDLRRLGFCGDETQILQQADSHPFLLASCSSASSMWTANACTFAPSLDTSDGKAHFTPSNLVSKLHRSIEPRLTSKILRAIFKDPTLFEHHDPLPATESMGDEGAANHTRLAPAHSSPGLHLFVYGKTHTNPREKKPKLFPARQTREASESVARLHRLPQDRTVFAQQNPDAIDAGVFHNDVISVGNESVFFFHEKCFAQPESIQEIQEKWGALHGSALNLIRVPEKEVSLQDAVQSYLFNSQLVTLPSKKMALIAPQECESTRSVRVYLEKLVQSGSPIEQVHYPQLRQSMQNGGGPACLRSRVVLSVAQIKACAPGVFLDVAKIATLENWVEKHYRDRLQASDLADPHLLRESREALDSLTQILGLGSLYDFQQ